MGAAARRPIATLRALEMPVDRTRPQDKGVCPVLWVSACFVLVYMCVYVFVRVCSVCLFTLAQPHTHTLLTFATEGTPSPRGTSSRLASPPTHSPIPHTHLLTPTTEATPAAVRMATVLASSPIATVTMETTALGGPVAQAAPLRRQRGMAELHIGALRFAVGNRHRRSRFR